MIFIAENPTGTYPMYFIAHSEKAARTAIIAEMQDTYTFKAIDFPTLEHSNAGFVNYKTGLDDPWKAMSLNNLVSLAELLGLV